MRIDKFLKVTRLIKRRTLAKDVLDHGLALVNGRPAKPATMLKPGDEIFIRLGRHELKIRVLALANTPTRQEATSLYEIIEDKLCEPEHPAA